jgi:Fur family peroxide stress response transcriptional regulator
MLVTFSPGNDESFAAICREQHWKRTVQRRAVFNFLCGNRDHPSVESVWHGVRAALPDVSLDSVYRILDDFSAAGVVSRLEGAKVIRYDADTRPHEHFVCYQCGRMDDFTCLESELVAERCREFGRIEAMELTVRGTCRLCLEKHDSAGSKC